MSDMNKRGPDCDDCGDEERGERGKRGKRGHRGHDGRDGNDGSPGPTGPTGPTITPGTPSVLKFCGAGISTAPNGVTYLADFGVFLDGLVTIGPPSYPAPVDFTVIGMAVNLLTAVPQGGTITIDLLKNGLETGFTLSYTAGPGGKKFTFGDLGPVDFIGPPLTLDTFDIRVTVAGITAGNPFDLSVTLSLE